MGRWSAITICALVVIAEGYDLIVYGALLPSLLREPGWELTRADAGTLGSAAYLGMLVGALVVGRLSDLFGRRPFVLGSLAWFTVWTIACALAGAPWHLGVFRLLAGVGMGAVLPVVLALARELAPADRTGVVFTVLMAGLPAGGMLASLTGLVVLPVADWRVMFLIGGVASVIVLIVAFLRLPDSAEYRGRAPDPIGFSVLFAPGLLLSTMLFPLANLMMLLTWYGLNTWLTTLMHDLSHPLASALRFSTVLNLGALAGSFALAALCLRWGTRRVAGLSALLAGLGILGCVLHPGSTVVFLGLIALIGAGAHSALNLITASVADSYPVALRATAIGWTHGLGRAGAIVSPSLGGWILEAELGPTMVLGAFMVTAVLGAVFLGLLSLGPHR
ncbi:MFS transporter [Nonomuraea sp. MG754425]|uniref:MFS transporter n=1 Tax=Nonomuraea sp. MG754425 TaxID=2570319 RepID=UPI001F0212FB|nr:MFS transporter [Nonomuraea sp. MG754425]